MEPGPENSVSLTNVFCETLLRISHKGQCRTGS